MEKVSQTNLNPNQPVSKTNRHPILKNPVDGKEVSSSSFNFYLELGKIKVPMPLPELLKITIYKQYFAKILQPSLPTPDTINL